MPKAILQFTKKSSSFSVKIQNLEQLTVEQIQEFQSFVKKRNGIFDFDKYEFIIQKNLQFYEFVALIEHAGLDAEIKENIVFAKNEPRISFGQYKGMFYSDLDDTYLIWLKSNYRGIQREFIDYEVNKRNI